MFCAFDTEDNTREFTSKGKASYGSKIVQAAAIGEEGDRYHFGDSRDKLLHFIEHSSYDKFYAHNLQYDLGVLFRNNFSDLDITFVGGRLIKARYRNKTLLDSMNIFPMALARLGEQFGLNKMVLDEHSQEYIFRDCEIVVKAIRYAQDFAKEFDVKLPNTLGGLAFAIFKSIGLKNENCDFIPDGLERPPYLYGGRCELFREDCSGKIIYADINSLYPAMMLNKYPDHVGKLTTKRLPKYGVAEVSLEVPECHIAPLPYRREDDSIFYPTGKLNGWWTVPEIENALEKGAKLLKIHNVLGSESGNPCYAPFVRNLYKRRLNAKNHSEKLMLKLCMNNLYGQLCTRGEITRYCHFNELKHGMIIAGDKALMNHKIPLPVHTNYIHGSYVTSYGRIELQKLLNQIAPENLIYTDTDSIIFNGEKFQPFSFSDKLGELKLEKERQYCRTYSPKCYELDGEHLAKGVKKDLAKEFNLKGEASYDQPFKLKESIHFYQDDSVKGNFRASVWRKVTKFRRQKYDKKVLRDGIYYPINLDS